jgi:two-component system response regulator HydG
MAQLLVIDDNATLREGMVLSLNRAGHTVVAASSGSEGLELASHQRFDLVVTDLKMEPIDGLEVVRTLRARDPEAAVLVVTAFGTIETAVEAMKLGALDFIQKPFSPEVLRAKVEKGVEVAELRKEAGALREQAQGLREVLSGPVDAAGLIGDSPPMQALAVAVRRIAATDATALIEGESGTGKELVARALHDLSPRREGPFVSVNCAAVPEGLLESEMFGHERGSFTGAVRRKLGRFELADHGTLFLDEVSEMPLSLQPKLLRLLQEREFQRVGGEATIKADVRLVTATNRDLSAEVKRGAFREDLYYRLAIVPLKLPPLRDRPGDVVLLAKHFVAKHAHRINPRVTGITDRALEQLQKYRWPGNVRELENAIERALVFAEGDQIDVSHLADLPGTTSHPTVSLGDHTLPELLDELERQLIAEAYQKANGKKTEAARLLGIKTSALYYKLEKYGFIERGAAKEEEGDPGAK